MNVEIGDRALTRGFNRGGAQDDRGVEDLGSADREKSGVAIAKVWGDDRVNKVP